MQVNGHNYQQKAETLYEMTHTRADSGDKLGVNCNHIQIASNSLLFKKDVSPNKIADRTANLFFSETTVSSQN